MGGNALKNVVTRRYERDEYFFLEELVMKKLRDHYSPEKRIVPIRAYNNKESFGDMDILIEGDYTAENFIGTIQSIFEPKQIYKNSNCISFEYKEFQIDLIVTPTEEFDTSYNYFNYNDLGNLCGRIAHSMGLKLGHDGLSYNWRIDTYQFKNVVLLTDWNDILPVLGLDPEVYNRGFDELEDIFKFVVSSQFFNKDIFLLHNRNHTSRVRDAKRKTYMEFLDWIEVDGNAVNNYSKKENKDDWLEYLFVMIDGFQTIYGIVNREWEDATAVKAKFNGDIVRGYTGLEGKDLGIFMKYMKDCSFPLSDDKWILFSTPEQIKEHILFWFKCFKE